MATRNHILLLGCGNIGSPLAQLLARMSEIAILTLCDPDFYKSENISGQAIDLRHVNRSKVSVQGEIVKRIRPTIEVRPIPALFEQVPVADLECDLIVSGLDRRLARMHAGELSYLLNAPFVDAGVLAGQALARLNSYLPGPDSPCIECGWSAEDRRNLEVEYACSLENEAPATNSPAFLGSLAAAMAAADVAKILAGNIADSLIGQQVIIGVQKPCYVQSKMTRNACCQFDHRVAAIDDTCAGLLDTVVGDLLTEPSSAISVPWADFRLRTTCAGCGDIRPGVRMQRFRERPAFLCAKCGSISTAAMPFDVTDRVTAVDLGELTVRPTLRSIGLRAGDVVVLTEARETRHLLVRK